MKRLNDFIAWLYIMVTIVLGLIFVLAVNGWYGLKDRTSLIVTELLNSSTGLWTGLVLVVLGILFLSFRVKAGKVTRKISFDNPEGEVTVSIKAIEDFVKRIGQEFPQVLELSPTVLPSNGGIKVNAKTTLIAGNNVPKLAENIQSSIKERMQNTLGIENVTGIEVNVVKLVEKRKESKEDTQQQINYGEGIKY